MAEIANRLKLALKMKGISGRKQAKICDIPYPTLRKYLEGSRNPGGENLKKIASRMGLNLNWLLTGEGEMFLPATTNLGGKGRLFASPGKETKESEKYRILEKIFLMAEDMTEEELRDVAKYIEKEKLFKELLKEREKKEAG